MKITKKYESSAVNTFKNGNPIDFSRGKGEFLYTKKNKRYLDLVCGSAVTNLGHGHKAHKEVIKQVSKTGIFHTGTRLPNYFRECLYKELSNKVPMGMVGEEIDYANLVAFLSSKRSAYITGTAINLDGGLCPVV